ncbi:MAG: pyridoxal phosphate-dependent aminotransferase [Candidatus Merdivicinus sp.]|jgi:histidinol-phosphate aminotransferase
MSKGYELCEKVRNLTPYDPLEGEYRIRLDANESYFEPDETLRQELGQIAAKTAFNRYPDPYAVEVCQAFADLYSIPESLVTAGNGSDELISIICGTLLQKGDKVLTFAPDFSMYRFYAELYELESVVLDKEADLTLSVDKAISYINENNIAAVIFSNPCNPTGQGVSRDEVRKLVSSVKALIVLDEAYMDFWDQSFLSEVQDHDNLIILKTCSKAIGMAAVRLGFAVANPTLSIALRAAKSPYNVNSISQAIGACILSKKELLADCREKLVESAQELYQRLDKLAKEFPILEWVYPTCTNFVFVKTDAARDIYGKLLDKSIAVRCFGKYLRITAPSPEQMEELFAALRDILVEMGEKA